MKTADGLRKVTLTAFLMAMVSALLVSGLGSASARERVAAPAALTPAVVMAPAGINGEAPPPPGFRFSNRFETGSAPGFPNATEQCLAFGRTMQEKSMVNDFYCWDTAPGTFSELWVTP